jgi:hypothetical protein
MQLNIRTDEHTLTAKFSGDAAILMTASLAVNPNIQVGTNKAGEKVFKALDNCKINLKEIGVEMTLYFFKGFYAVIKDEKNG